MFPSKRSQLRLKRRCCVRPNNCNFLRKIGEGYKSVTCLKPTIATIHRRLTMVEYSAHLYFPQIGFDVHWYGPLWRETPFDISFGMSPAICRIFCSV